MANKKVALITGAGKGIGREIALALADSGIDLALATRSENDLQSLIPEIEKSGQKAIVAQLDVSAYEGLERFARETYKKFGQIDYLFVNAGIGGEKASVLTGSAERWKEVIDTNLTGAYYTVKAVLPYLTLNTHAKIILIGSGLGHRGQAGNTAYSVSKAGLWMFTRLLAQELAEHNISVNEIIPGPVKTNIDKNSGIAFSDTLFNSEWIKTPTDVIPLIQFLLAQPETGPTGQSFSLARRDL
jgi:Dehydrogenases with different specificities (related to short-chain alcohol dehydrogenases)